MRGTLASLLRDVVKCVERWLPALLRMHVLPQPQTFADVALAYLDWAKGNRTEKFWKRQERILNEDVFPAIGNLPLSEITDTLISSALNLPNEKQKEAAGAINVAMKVMDWYLTQLGTIRFS